MKHLIINSDDFGLSTVFNRVILDLIRRKIVSSTTVMVDHMANSELQIQQTNELIALRATQISVWGSMPNFLTLSTLSPR